ncbi:3-hydroxybutyryl-CoA dehydratase [Halogeometricum rufum]|jgi:3-hydroxybutyryl-CoA dehydratase|uniref:3-hydroxybutyryl-CoA dehydratase n=1 Tax=Halogeometricum rufum TaxID=553469 RepID=A0A1I6J012_9EURY|nr:MaoC family dehydratase [Halogeometricum rufum]SFR72307.1 3-hydroxybutyryl-CoA dehydratase [Halogeometricum rufum]
MPVATTGDAAEASLSVTESTIDEFAALSGDDNPIHLDDDYAAETMFGGRIAHGMLAASVVSAALADLPGDVIYLSQDLSFENPVRPGDEVVARAEVDELLGGDRIRVETTARVGDVDVVTGEAVVLSVSHGDAN